MCLLPENSLELQRDSVASLVKSLAETIELCSYQKQSCEGLRLYSLTEPKRVDCSVGVRHAPVFQLDHHWASFCLTSLISMPAIGELNSWLLCTIFVLIVGVAAIEKRAHHRVSEASSGPRSMA